MDVFVGMIDPNLITKINHELIQHPLHVERRKYIMNDYTHLQVWPREWNSAAWEALTKNGLLAEITFLNSKKSIPLFGNFSSSSLTTVHMIEEEEFKLTFIVDKKNLKINPTPIIRFVTKKCDKKGRKYSCKW